MQTYLLTLSSCLESECSIADDEIDGLLNMESLLRGCVTLPATSDIGKILRRTIAPQIRSLYIAPTWWIRRPRTTTHRGNSVPHISRCLNRLVAILTWAARGRAPLHQSSAVRQKPGEKWGETKYWGRNTQMNSPAACVVDVIRVAGGWVGPRSIGLLSSGRPRRRPDRALDSATNCFNQHRTASALDRPIGCERRSVSLPLRSAFLRTHAQVRNSQLARCESRQAFASWHPRWGSRLAPQFVLMVLLLALKSYELFAGWSPTARPQGQVSLLSEYIYGSPSNTRFGMTERLGSLLPTRPSAAEP